MRNKEFQKLLKKQKYNSNSGFTLTELLVGLFMSIFVIGALGFGLMTVLRTTQTEGSRVEARNEASRALDFITDEMRRAKAVEVDTSLTNVASLASNFRPLTEVNGSGVTVNVEPSLVLQMPGLDQPVIYTVAPPQNNTWKGPLVIYRWGPALRADGSYSNPTTPGSWQNQALVDEISDINQTITCGGNSVTYSGFYACVVDDDGDGVTENADSNNDGFVLAIAEDIDGDGTDEPADTATIDVNSDGTVDSKDLDMNRDGEIDAEDNADSDGKAISAQLYFTGGTVAAIGGDSGYSADTQAVARARVAPENNSEDLSSYTMSFRTLNPSFACNTNPTDNWEMRTDFGESLSNPSNLTQWNHIQNRQPQPIKITGDTLVISSIPRNTSGTCLNSRANNGREADRTPPRDFSGNKTLGASEDWTTNDDVVAISHAINFKDPRTFNGDPDPCPSYPCASSADAKVYSQKDGAAAALNPAVKVLKHGSVVPDFGGYDPEGDGTDADGDGNVDSGNQRSLGEFLATRNPPLAVADGTFVNGAIKYVITDKLQPDERIIAFEIGKDTITSGDPGVDFQDNIFIVSSKAFKEKYSQYEDNGTTADYTPLN